MHNASVITYPPRADGKPGNEPVYRAECSMCRYKGPYRRGKQRTREDAIEHEYKANKTAPHWKGLHH